MNYVKYRQEAHDGPIHGIYAECGRYCVAVAWSSANWYDTEKPRKIPLWIDREGLFAWRLAFSIRIKGRTNN